VRDWLLEGFNVQYDALCVMKLLRKSGNILLVVIMRSRSGQKRDAGINCRILQEMHQILQISYFSSCGIWPKRNRKLWENEDQNSSAILRRAADLVQCCSLTVVNNDMYVNGD